jgi:hypothetical protein
LTWLLDWSCHSVDHQLYRVHKSIATFLSVPFSTPVSLRSRPVFYQYIHENYLSYIRNKTSGDISRPQTPATLIRTPFLFFILRSPVPAREGGVKYRDSALFHGRGGEGGGLPAPNASCSELLPIVPDQYWKRDSQGNREQGEKRVAPTNSQGIEHLCPKQGKRKGEHGPGDLQVVHIIVRRRRLVSTIG